MTFHKKLVGKKCYLSTITLDDAEKWSQWFNDLEVTIPLGDEAYQLTSLEDEQATITSILQHKAVCFSIRDVKTNDLVGRVGLFQVNKTDRNAMFGIVIGEKTSWNKGYGQEATKLMLDYGFNILNLHNIMLGVFSFNKRAIKCYEKVGFKEIGRRRQSRIIGGKKFDVIFMDILADEFTSIYVTHFLE